MKIVVKANGGLGNRMRVISSCVALTQKLNTAIDVVWVNNYELNCNYSNLFEPIRGLTVTDVSYIPRWNKIGLSLRARKLKKTYENFDRMYTDTDILAVHAEDKDIVDSLSDVKSVFIDTCQLFYGGAQFLSYLVPIAPIRMEIKRRINQMNSPYVGVHIRRGDNVKAKVHSNTPLFVSLMCEKMEQYPGIIFFLATDDKKELAILKNVFGNRVFHFTQELKRNRPTHIVHALVDLMVLAHASEILGSYFSSFSEVAAAIGKIKLHVVKDEN